MKTKAMGETFQRMDSKGFYRLEIPENLNMARVAVDFWAEHGRGPDVAIYYNDQKIIYQDFKDVTDRFANAMHKLGAAGDREE